MGQKPSPFPERKTFVKTPSQQGLPVLTMRVLLLFSIIVVFICTLENVNGQDHSLEKREVEGERDLVRKARETMPKKNEERPKHKKMKGKNRKGKDSHKKKRRGPKGDKKAHRREKGDKKDKKKMKMKKNK